VPTGVLPLVLRGCCFFWVHRTWKQENTNRSDAAGALTAVDSGDQLLGKRARSLVDHRLSQPVSQR
jgi:hypothetical protein